MITTVTLNPALDKLYLINNFKPHKLHRLGDLIKVSTTPGGKGINVAVFLNRLGLDVSAMGFIGGHTGRILEEMVRDEKIISNFIFVENDTRIDSSIVDEKNSTLTEINESGPPIFKEDIDNFMERYERILDDSELIIISGSIPPNTPTDIYARLIDIANNRKIKTILNTARIPLEKGIEAGPTIVYPDMRSAYNLFDSKTETLEDYVSLAKLIHSKNKNIETVVFTNPLKNLYIASVEDRIYQISIENSKIVNLFGFGDALVGGLVYALTKEEPTTEILRTGIAAGFVNMRSIKKQIANIEDINEAKSKIKIAEI